MMSSIGLNLLIMLFRFCQFFRSIQGSPNNSDLNCKKLKLTVDQVF